MTLRERSKRLEDIELDMRYLADWLLRYLISSNLKKRPEGLFFYLLNSSSLFGFLRFISLSSINLSNNVADSSAYEPVVERRDGFNTS